LMEELLVVSSFLLNELGSNYGRAWRYI
jgi:hypothetical protein